MNTEYLIENLRFEILKPYHNLSNFKCKSRKLNKYLKNDALQDQKLNNKVTHLVICDAQLIGFFTLGLDVDGLSQGEYDDLKAEIPNLPDIDKFPIVTILKFAIDKKFESGLLAATIFDNIIYNLKKIFKENRCFDGVSINVGDDCIFPPIDESSLDNQNINLEDIKEELASRGEYIHLKKV